MSIYYIDDFQDFDQFDLSKLEQKISNVIEYSDYLNHKYDLINKFGSLPIRGFIDATRLEQTDQEIKEFLSYHMFLSKKNSLQVSPETTQIQIFLKNGTSFCWPWQ